MTVSTEDSRTDDSGNGIVTIFNFPYYFLADADLKVILVDALGVETPQVITTHYTVSGAGVGAGGAVTMIIAPATGERLVIYRDPTVTQGVDYITGDAFPANVHETALDRLTMIVQRVKDLVSRAITLSEGAASVDLTLPTPTANTAIVWDPTASALAIGPTVTDISNAQANAALTAADVITTNADVVLTNADVVLTNADVVSTAASASAAQAAADSVIWNDVQFKAFADTPIAVSQSDDGALIAVDTSGGNVVINLPSIAALTLPFTIGVKKTTGDVNTVTINRNGTDTIEGNASYILVGQDDGATLIPDTDTSPDRWSLAAFGTGVSLGGNHTWSGDNDFPAAADGLTRGGVEVATVEDINPLGVPVPLPTSVVPVNYLAVPNAPTTVSRATYSELHTLMAADSYPWGNGDGSTTFNIPFLIEGHVPVQANGNVASATVGAVISHGHTYDRLTGVPGPFAQGTTAALSTGNTSVVGGTYNEAAGNKFKYAMRYR